MILSKRKHYLYIPLLVALGGCNAMGGFNPAPATKSAVDDSVTIVARDVEAPEVFSATAPGQWNGKPTLGGVWVAYPNVKEPERVLVRNTATNQFVIGALFPRDPALSGREFQVSSEAATALGIAPNTAPEISVVALRPEQDSTVEPSAGLAPAEVAVAELDGGTPPAPLALDAKPTQVVSAVPAKPATVSKVSKPFIQSGIFSIKANAERTAKTFNAAGIPTRVVEMQIKDKSFWRVISGPAQTEAARKTILEQIKSQGFADAYAVSN